MTRDGHPLLLLLALLLLPLSACPGERDEVEVPSPAVLTLRVVDDETGEPKAGIKVYLRSPRGEVLQQGYTDERGLFDFGVLLEGKYQVLAGRRILGYVPAGEEVEFERTTEVVLALRRYEGFRVRIVPPEGVPIPKHLKVVYRKAGRSHGPLVRIELDEKGEGHTWSIFPGSYEMVFTVRGFAEVTRPVELAHVGVEPVVVEIEPR